MPEASGSVWLTLSQAAERVGVHPTTLRRWADRGEVPSLRTPGGHRRFNVADLDRLSAETPEGSGVEFAWAGKAMTRVREQLERPDGAQWLTEYSEAERTEYRELGRRLMSVAMHYIADPDSDRRLLDEANLIGEAQAALALRHGMTLTRTMAAALSFRDALVDVAVQLPDHARPHGDANARLLRRINGILNAVQLGISQKYETAYLGSSS